MLESVNDGESNTPAQLQTACSIDTRSCQKLTYVCIIMLALQVNALQLAWRVEEHAAGTDNNARAEMM